MKKLNVLAAVVPALLIVGCATPQDGPAPASAPSAAAAQIRDAAGQIVAAASVREVGGLTVRVDAAGLRPGVYSVHLHAVGRCDPPGFGSAGMHWNPTSHQHGRLNPLGPHFGDLPNLEVGADGGGRIEFAIPAGSLRQGENVLLDADGAAVVVHANADDYRTDPTGNSGARIACGVLG
jgi:Cu-Zn family superoxide dismutase